MIDASLVQASSNSTWCLWLKDVDLYIKDYSQWALQHVKADSQRAELILTSFCADMTQLCLATLLDFSSICSVMDTAGRLSVAAQQQQPAGLSPTTQQLVPDLVRKLSKQLWPQRHQLRAYHVASVLTALSRTDEQMDTMPGLADALAEQFMQDSECYNAHRFASSLYSCAQMNINPCDGQLLEHILQRLPKLSLANFGARNVANTLFALTRVPILHHPAPVIDKLCNRMIRLMSSSKEEERPTEDDAASFLRSLRTLQHKPKDEFAPALVSWYAHVLQGLQDQSEQKASQRVGIILKACVDLRLQIPHRFIPMLLPHVFGIRNRRHPKRVKAEARASAARGLAALGILDQDTFQSLLSSAPQSLPWSAADLTQLRHALDWLQPESSDHPDHDKWLQLHKQLSASGQRPDPEVARSQPAVGAVCTVLEQCGVQYATGVQLGSCVAAVVIVAVGTTDAVIDVIGQEGTFKNEPKRCISIALFLQWHQLSNVFDASQA